MAVLQKSLFVGGDFDRFGGKPSHLVRKIFDSIGLIGSEPPIIMNGGCFSDLENVLAKGENFDVVAWFANVSNDEPKLVRQIKRNNPSSIFVSSKRNIGEKYSFGDLVYHALGLRSNLLVEFSKLVDSEQHYHLRIIDPLGNLFLDYSTDFGLVGATLKKRIVELSNTSRVSSVHVGGKTTIPDEPQFFNIIKSYASVFHDLIHAHPDAANRFMGNASFRCERGFPSFRNDGGIYVSRRNLDKRFVGKESFVKVLPGNLIQYFGDHKPSVDSPIHLELYNRFPLLNYAIHSHVYIEGAPFTENLIPCGALEEVDEISNKVNDNKISQLFINLRGHGSLAMSNSIDALISIPYYSRPVPELVQGYLNS